MIKSPSKNLLGVVLLVVLVVPFTSASVSVSCDSDDDCFFFSGREGVCIESVCEFDGEEVEVVEEAKLPIVLDQRNDNAAWGFVTYSAARSDEEDEIPCSIDGCLQLAPERSKSSFVRFLEFIAYIP